MRGRKRMEKNRTKQKTNSNILKQQVPLLYVQILSCCSNCTASFYCFCLFSIWKPGTSLTMIKSLIEKSSYWPLLSQSYNILSKPGSKAISTTETLTREDVRRPYLTWYKESKIHISSEFKTVEKARHGIGNWTGLGVCLAERRKQSSTSKNFSNEDKRYQWQTWPTHGIICGIQAQATLMRCQCF